LDDHEGDIGALRGYTTWQAIPDRVIEYENAGLTPLSARAFQFYIPAYMKWSLLNFHTSNSATSDTTIYALAPGSLPRSYTVARYALLSAPQIHAVVSFLQAMAASPDYADARVAEEALNLYWLPRLPAGV
jgi:hypothetical protein